MFMFAFRIRHNAGTSANVLFFRGEFHSIWYFISFLQNESGYIRRSSKGVALNTGRPRCFLRGPKTPFKTFLSLYYNTISYYDFQRRYHYASLYDFKFRWQNKRLLYITSPDVFVRYYNNRLRGNGQTHEQYDILVCAPETFFGE